MPLRAPEDTDDKHAPAVPNGVPPTILPICKEIAGRVNAFLESEQETPLLRQVQEQTRVALGAISTVLERYRFAVSSCFQIWRKRRLTWE